MVDVTRLPPVKQSRADIQMMADGIGHGHKEQESDGGVGDAQEIQIAMPPVDLGGAPSAQ
jgi:hypothetical protein